MAHKFPASLPPNWVLDSSVKEDEPEEMVLDCSVKNDPTEETTGQEFHPKEELIHDVNYVTTKLQLLGAGGKSADQDIPDPLAEGSKEGAFDENRSVLAAVSDVLQKEQPQKIEVETQGNENSQPSSRNAKRKLVLMESPLAARRYVLRQILKRIKQRQMQMDGADQASSSKSGELESKPDIEYEPEMEDEELPNEEGEPDV